MAELSEIQALVSETRHRRGFTTDPVQIFTLLTEEVGEVAARYDIDLETAVRNKFIAADATRTWATAVEDG